MSNNLISFNYLVEFNYIKKILFKIFVRACWNKNKKKLVTLAFKVERYLF